jgi:hypothetical protein
MFQLKMPISRRNMVMHRLKMVVTRRNMVAILVKNPLPAVAPVENMVYATVVHLPNNAEHEASSEKGSVKKAEGLAPAEPAPLPLPRLPVETSILDRFGDVLFGYPGSSLKVGDGAGHLQYPRAASSGKAEAVGYHLQHPASRRIGIAKLPDHPGGHLGIATHAGPLVLPKLRVPLNKSL